MSSVNLLCPWYSNRLQRSSGHCQWNARVACQLRVRGADTVRVPSRLQVPRWSKQEEPALQRVRKLERDRRVMQMLVIY